MTIEPKISKYIDVALERKHNELDKSIRGYINELNTENKRHVDDFNNENRHHMNNLKEFFQHDVQMLAELINDRPTREEAHDIAREEIYNGLKQVNAKLDYLNEERQQMLEAISEIKA